MARYRYEVNYEVQDGSWDGWEDGFRLTSGSDTFGSWVAYGGTLLAGDEIQFINYTTRETDLRSLSGFTNNSDIIAGSSYIGYASTRTIASGASSVSFTMHVTDHPGAPITTRTFTVSVPATGVTHQVYFDLEFVAADPPHFPNDSYEIIATPETLDVSAGDTVDFTFRNFAGGSYTGEITGFDAGEWNDTSNALNIPHNTTISRTVVASSGSDVVTYGSSASSDNATITFTFSSSSDTTPDAFSLGPDITSANLNTNNFLAAIKVTGLGSTSTATASITNGVTLLNSANVSSATSAAKTVSNGDYIYVWGTASSSYNTSVTTTLNVGGVTDSAVLTTKEAPRSAADGQIIPLGIVSPNPIDMLTLREFFGRPTDGSDTIAMTDLYRGGDLVPNIIQNFGVPTSGTAGGTISLGDLHGTSTSFYIQTELGYFSNAFILDSPNTSGTIEIITDPNSGGDVEIGYGAQRRAESVQFRYTVTGMNQPGTTIQWGYTGAEQDTNPGNPFTTPWLDNLANLRIYVDYDTDTQPLSVIPEGIIIDEGLITLEARKVWNGTTYTASSTGTWKIIAVVEEALTYDGT